MKLSDNGVAKKIQRQLFALQDEPYKAFQSKLIPTINPHTVIGVRTPELRKFARDIAKTPDATVFIQILPHTYYEENNLHGFILETIKDFGTAVAEVERFLPYVDNWATCDLMSPKVFRKHPAELLEKIKVWLSSGKTYTVRFGIEMLMSIYLDENFTPELPKLVVAVHSEEYYVHMMIAWYFATALAKQYDAVIPFIENKILAPQTHNKTIQKAIESYRILPEVKAYLRTLKIPHAE